MKKKLGRNLLTILCMIVLTAGSISLPVGAYSVKTSGVISNNIHDHEYTERQTISNSYIADNKNGTFSRVENMGDVILVEDYDMNMQLLEQHFLTMELPIFGGFYSGTNYNYALFGRMNPDKNNNLECIRLVRYTKQWQRVGGTGLCWIDTLVPFFGCNTDFAEYGDNLYVRAGRRTYNGTMKLINLRFQISTGKLLTNYNTGLMINDVATFIDCSDGVLTVADHVLENPRALFMSRYNKNDMTYAIAFTPSGTPGTATTGTTIGGYESSGQYKIMVGSAPTPDGKSTNRNVYVAAVPKNDFSGKKVQISYLTGYAYGDVMTVMNPFLVKVDSEHFVVIWESREGYRETETVNYVYLNGTGRMSSPIYSEQACISDCQPEVINGRVIWYVTDGQSMKLYSIPAYNGEKAPTQEATTAVVYGGVDYSPVYDFAYYINRYPDMRVLYAHDSDGALKHFVTVGMLEGRRGSENFDPYIYAKNYPELQAAFGGDFRQYYLHFINIGAAEGRKAR